jgi:type VI secretion system secreted protein VgrG
MIGMMPAWRCLPAGMAAAVEGLSGAMDALMSTPVMTPADAAPKVIETSMRMGQVGGAATMEGNGSSLGTAASSVSSLSTTFVSLSATWAVASAVPGGAPAANAAFTTGIKAAAGAAASAVFASMAGMADMHMCPMPAGVVPHGPGFVTQGSPTVIIDGLPLARQDDKVFEACGGQDPIVMGCPTVNVDAGSGSSGTMTMVGPNGETVELTVQQMEKLSAITDGNSNIDIRGSDEFKEKTTFALAQIISTPTGEGLIDSIEAGDHQVKIVEAAEGKGNSCGYDSPDDRYQDSEGNPGEGTDSTVKFNPDNPSIGSEPWETRPPAIGLAHELVHAEQASNGTHKPGEDVNDGAVNPKTGDPATVEKDELEAAGIPPYDTYPYNENKIRSEWDPKQPEREFY